MRIRHESRATLLPVHDETNPVVVRMKAIEHREKAFARHAERKFDSLFDEAFDDQVPRCLLLVHGTPDRLMKRCD